MTVATQVKQSITSLKSAQASFEGFAMQTQDQAAKQLYTTAATQTQAILDTVQQRVNYLEQEEPAYQGF